VDISRPKNFLVSLFGKRIVPKAASGKDCGNTVLTCHRPFKPSRVRSTMPSERERLSLLLGKWGFRLPTASAILTVLYPEQFTVYDVRVRTGLRMRDICDRHDVVEAYFKEYLPTVAELPQGATLREKDRYLWGKSTYEDLQQFIKNGPKTDRAAK
jgi:hypothetical protein